MAKKRMLDAALFNSDDFADMTLSAQILYVHLILNADDDGFVDSHRRAMRSLGVKRAALNELIEAGLVISFPNEVLLISDWLRHNKIRADRYVMGMHKHLLSSVKITKESRYIKG